MNSTFADWRADLEASRNLSELEKQHFGFVLAWFETWRIKLGLEARREAVVRFLERAGEGKTAQGLATGPVGGGDAVV